ncbi:hypothetical protein ABPG77_003110 [Micractinium sp. CCAP 211/92]
MRIWNAFYAGECLEELQQSLEAFKVALQQEPDLPQDDERRHAVRVAYRALLKAMGDVTPEDPGPEAKALMGMDVGGQTAILGSVEKAIGVMQLVQKHADWWPAQQAQGWGYKLGRVLSFMAGTSLIDLATALGFPPYLGRVRALLIALHWATPPAVVWVAFHGGTPAVLALMASSVAWAIGDQDLPARAQGLAALQAGQATAAELWEESRVAEACPRLSGALYATADCYAAVLERDRQRSKDMRQMERLYRSWMT